MNVDCGIVRYHKLTRSNVMSKQYLSDDQIRQAIVEYCYKLGYIVQTHDIAFPSGTGVLTAQLWNVKEIGD